MITGKYLKSLRERVGISQTELARLANISQAHIAKIETEKVNPRLSTVNVLLSILQRKEKDKTCGEIMSKKVIPVKTTDSAKKAISLMRSFDISQVPVIDKGKVIGSVTESTIIRNMGKNPAHVKIGDIMDAPFPIVSEEDSVDILPELLNLRQAVLVSSRGRIKGIITKFNLLSVK
ncbi:MAG: CBS domain-containing protein [Candidatus Aenigmatarchaeota archaeon]|nr:MAG: CBS domain-containing protein [Candidatus Aenigmarchaeota archaeon]